MDIGDAEVQLRRMCAAESPPELDDIEVRDLAVLATTRGLYAAAAQGWRSKAAKVAGDFGFSTDGNRFDRDQAYAHCMQMADWYHQRAGSGGQGGSLGVVTVRSPTAAAAEGRCL